MADSLLPALAAKATPALTDLFLIVDPADTTLDPSGTAKKTTGDGVGSMAAGSTAMTAALALKAPVASPTFTGTPAAPTPATSDNSTTIATTAYVKKQATALQGTVLAEYRFDDGAGTQLTDYSANTYHGTLAGTSLPIWSSLGLTFGGSANTLVNLPAAALATAQTIMIFSDANALLNTSKLGILLGNAGASTNLHLFAQASNGSTSNVAIFGTGGYNTQSSDTVAGPCGIAATFDGTGTVNDRIYVDGVEVGAYQTQGKDGAYRSGAPQLGGSTPFAQSYPGTIYYAVFFSTLLTPAQVAANTAIIAQALRNRGVVFNPVSTSTTKNLVCNGDSITVSINAPTWEASLALAETFTVRNCGISGSTALQLAASTAGLCKSYYNPLAGRNVALLWAGTNDWFYAPTIAPATVLGYIRAACVRARAQGFEPVVIGMLSRNNGGTIADPFKNQLNDLLRKECPALGVPFIDPAAAPVLGADGAYANTTYFSDQIHPTGTANTTVLAPWISSGLNAYLMGYTGRFASSGSITVNTTAETSLLGPSPSDVTIRGATNSTTAVTGLDNTNWLVVGQSVTGSGIPAGTTVAAIPSTTTVTLSAAATTSLNPVALTFGKPVMPKHLNIPGRTYRAEACGVLTTTASPASLTLQFKHGSTVLATTGSVALAASLTSAPWRAEILSGYAAVGASGTVWTEGTFWYQSAAGTWTPIPLTNTGTVAEDTTASYVVDLTATLSAASGNSLTATNATHCPVN